MTSAGSKIQRLLVDKEDTEGDCVVGEVTIATNEQKYFTYRNSIIA
ncbi:hypothetical protein C8139_RS10220 [Enterococcus faecium]|nr:hypothetical protein [Enterococcus faecium]